MSWHLGFRRMDADVRVKTHPEPWLADAGAPLGEERPMIASFLVFLVCSIIERAAESAEPLRSNSDAAALAA
ncbi:hypothetical protein [Sphingomonas sp. PR090111-T3T-6A]|uniref:hypothetical protein n=1 Tax=Sphingomonas sp. PR090111-T3T-6A TaxID=685778 RepID=UPI0012F8474B|nr:hypothetical protein [Sphingomonas sp. PR090111-T3T-6A]